MEEDLQVKLLLMQAMNINRAIKELWATYTAAFEVLDLDDPDINGQVSDVLMELECNLIDSLDQVQGQIYLTTGIYEPLPIDEVEDFEASVLRDLGNLDSCNLDEYRLKNVRYE